MKRYKSVGTTGTRLGMSQPQALWLRDYLEHNVSNVLHHGDCVGSDNQVATAFSQKDTYIIAHPGSSLTYRAQCIFNDLVLPWTDNLIRNRLIVNKSDILLAFPGTEQEIPQSGTWHTIRYAKKQNLLIRIVTPSGLEL